MSSNKIVLISSDGESFEIEEAVARTFQMVSDMIGDDCAGKTLPLPNVTGKILALAIEYCKKHVDDDKEQVDEAAKKELVTWDEEFMKNNNLDTILSLINAANYLHTKDLLDFASKTVADRIEDMTPEEIRQVFNIEKDFTPEEEGEVRLENEWAFV